MPSAGFRLSVSQAVLDQVRDLARRAYQLGVGSEFRKAMEFIADRLARDPLGWGDPNYRLRRLGLLKCRGSRSFLHVHYAVDELRRIVYVTDLRPSPGSRLDVP
jgi:hypothetical protein